MWPKGYITKLPHIWHNCSEKPFMQKAKISIGMDEECSTSSFSTQGVIFLCRHVGKIMLTYRLTLKLKAKRSFPFGNKKCSFKVIFSKKISCLEHK